MAPRPDVSEQRRTQIIEAAVAVFSKLGFHRARMDDIVVESGLSKGSIYRYFESKDEIISTIFDSFFENGIADINASAAADGPVSERLRAIDHKLIEDIQRFTIRLPMTLEIYAFGMRHKSMRALIKKYLQYYRKLLASLIAEGVASGEFRKVNPQETAVQLIAFYEGLLLIQSLDPSIFDFSPASSSRMDLLLGGLQERSLMVAELKEGANRDD